MVIHTKSTALCTFPLGRYASALIGLLLLFGCQSKSEQATEPSATPPTSASSQAAARPSKAQSASKTAQQATTSSRPATSVASSATAAPNGAGSASVTVPEGMAKVPAGIFLMGASRARGNPEERPAHEAVVATFFFDQTEVTASAYRRCVADGKCKTSHPGSRFCTEHNDQKQDHPINCIDLRMAASYCAYVGKRLPTEREWEYAASGGSKQQRYSWGNSPEPSGKISCYGHPGTCKVGIFPPGAFDLYDVSGGVWEWTQSRYLPYPSRAKIDPIETGKLYVYRGGSWSRRFSKWLRTALRNRYRPNKSSGSIGVRCAKSKLPLECPADTRATHGECKRIRGTPLCEKDYEYNSEAQTCLPAGTTAAQARPRPTGRLQSPASGSPRKTPAASNSAAPLVITRKRTPQFDADCQKHWPGTKTSWLFTGGPNFPSRMPKLRSYGCKPRDMGWKWTSACCP